MKCCKKLEVIHCYCFISCFLIYAWCGRRDLNPHELPHQNLNLARLPFRHARHYFCYYSILINGYFPFCHFFLQKARFFS